MPSLRLTCPNRTCNDDVRKIHEIECVECASCTYLGDLGVLEALLLGDAVPVDVGLVLGVLHDGEEEHGLTRGGLLLVAVVVGLIDGALGAGHVERLGGRLDGLSEDTKRKFGIRSRFLTVRSVACD